MEPSDRECAGYSVEGKSNVSRELARSMRRLTLRSRRRRSRSRRRRSRSRRRPSRSRQRPSRSRSRSRSRVPSRSRTPPNQQYTCRTMPRERARSSNSSTRNRRKIKNPRMPERSSALSTSSLIWNRRELERISVVGLKIFRVIAHLRVAHSNPSATRDLIIDLDNLDRITTPRTEGEDSNPIVNRDLLNLLEMNTTEFLEDRTVVALTDDHPPDERCTLARYHRPIRGRLL